MFIGVEFKFKFFGLIEVIFILLLDKIVILVMLFRLVLLSFFLLWRAIVYLIFNIFKVWVIVLIKVELYILIIWVWGCKGLIKGFKRLNIVFIFKVWCRGIIDFIVGC